MNLLSKLFGGIWSYVIGIGAAVAGLGAAFLAIRRSGVKAEQQAETERSLKQSKESNEIDTSVHKLSDAELDKRLRGSQRD